MPGYQPTEAELQAAFLAARGHGKILDDDVLTAILTAAREAQRAAMPPCDGCTRSCVLRGTCKP